MKNKITNMTATLGIVFSLASCIDFRPSGPLPPDPPAEEEAPAIIVPDEDLVVYPASTGVSSEMEFRIEGLGEKGSVSITPDAGLDASLFFDRVDGSFHAERVGNALVAGPDTFATGVLPTRMMVGGVRKKPKLHCCRIWGSWPE